ncbi:WXG100 family type VII secretion target [Micromonospora sp. KLBMP9576]|uniref:WXG100 family type VII secretion target n=1 Tax=Micromonospora sp. KLBMP9576 TaxID=3424769 RepID=UPI003D8FDA3E
MSDIKYDYGAIAQGISEMQSINRAIEGLIESLARETGTALDNWQGDAADQYRQAAERIRTNFGDLNDVVAKLSVELDERAADMKQQDQRSAGGF